MTVSKDKWLAFVSRLSRTDTAAADALLEYINSHDVDSPAGRRDLVRYAYGICTKYGEAAAELSCQMYDAAAEASGANVPSAEPAETPSFGEVAKAINGARKQSQNEEHTAAVGARLVKQTGLDTTLKNAIRDGAEFAWVPHGDTCGFCLMLASNGWQNAPKGATTRAAHVHANCDCTYAVRFDKRSGVEGYDPDYYKMLWDEAKEAAEDYDGGTSWQDALNALRREHYEENREKINAQKRAAYAKRKAAEASSNAKYEDITGKWYPNATPGSHEVKELQEYSVNGTTYKVDGHNVVLDHSSHEKEIAELLAREVGGEVYLVPRVNNPQGVSTPDYLFHSKPYDLKTPKRTATENTIYNRIKKAKRQATAIIVDVSETALSDSVVDSQIHKVFWSAETRFVEEIAIIRNGKIKKVVRRKNKS